MADPTVLARLHFDNGTNTLARLGIPEVDVLQEALRRWRNGLLPEMPEISLPGEDTPVRLVKLTILRGAGQ